MSACPSRELLHLYAMQQVGDPADTESREAPSRHAPDFDSPLSDAEYVFIREHLRVCAACRAELTDAGRALATLGEELPADPGAEFTAAVLARAKRPVIRWPRWWPPVGRVMAWGIPALAALLILGIWLWPGQAGNNRIVVAAPLSVYADGPFVLPVIVTDAQGRPSPNSRVVIRARDGAANTTRVVYRGRTNDEGLCAAKLTVASSNSGNTYRTLDIAVTTPRGANTLKVPIMAEPAETLHLSTDKPLYQPGQTVHMRVLCLHRTATTPIAGREVTIAVRDGRDTLLFKTTETTSAWGVATADLPLDSEVETGDYTIEATAGEESYTRTITVSRYTLPKFNAALATSRGWYLPGETLRGTVDANYFFGKPCAGASVRLEALPATGLDEDAFATRAGTADAQGRFAFAIPLPAKLHGSPEHGGNAAVLLKARVTDAGGHTREISRAYPVSKEAILLSALPEAGAPVVGVENEFYLVASYPDGSPARATIHATQPLPATVRTDEQGIGVIRYTPRDGAVQVMATAEDAAGRTGRFTGTLTSVGARLGKTEYLAETGLLEVAAPTILIRTDQPVYRVGDTADILIRAPGQQGPLLLELTRDKQPVLTRTADLVDGRARVSVPITADCAGLLALHAFLPGALMTGGEDGGGSRYMTPVLAAQGSRTIVVQPAEELTVAIADLQTARPGEDQPVTLKVTDPDGRGVPAAVGLSGVDEAVFALEDQHPGLARVFFLLRQQLNAPTIEVHDEGLPARCRVDETIPDHPAAAKVAMAAYDMLPLLQVNRFGEREAEWARASEREKRTVATWVIILVLGVTMMATYLVRRWLHNATSPQHETSLGCLVPLGLFLSIGSLAILTGLISTAQDIEYDPGPFTLFLIFGGIWALLLIFIRRVSMRIDLISVALTMAILAIIAAILFPVFAKAREKARQSSATSVRQLQAAMDMAQQDNPPAARSGVSPASIRVREYFPETLAWLPEIVTDGKGEAAVTLPAADSITTWRLSLLAHTKDGRMGSADIPYTVFQEFFVELDVPVQLTVGDRFTLPVAVHNYAKTRQTIALTLETADGLLPAGEETAGITLDAGAVGTVRFPLRADAAGTATVTVRAHGASQGDAVTRTIPIVPRGERIAITRNGVLRGSATFTVNLPAEADVATSDLALRLYPGPVSQVLGGLEGLLQQPYGCFEQTTATTYPNIMVLRYLRESTSQNVEAIAKAQRYVMLGYQRLLSFEVKGGGFSLFGAAPAEFGLTALGLAEFQDMATVQAVDEAMLARTAGWLKANWGKADPIARSIAALPLAQAGEGALAGLWLSERAARVKTLPTYELAVLAQAAAKLSHQEAYRFVEELTARATTDADGAHWSRAEGNYHGGLAHRELWFGWNDVETTGLAVQALATDRAQDALVRKGCDFLVASRDANGGWNGTQSTVQALRALLAVNQAASRGDVTVTVNGARADTVTLAGDGVVAASKLSRYLRHGANTVTLTADDGVSPACQVVARYYSERPWRAAAARNPVTVTYDKTLLKSGDVATANVTVLLPARADMAMVDLAIPPGFLPFVEDLERMKDAGRIERYEMAGPQLIFYLRALPAGTPAQFRYRLRALFPVTATVRPSTVYPYYEPQTRYQSAPGKMEVL